MFDLFPSHTESHCVPWSWLGSKTIWKEMPPQTVIQAATVSGWGSGPLSPPCPDLPSAQPPEATTLRHTGPSCALPPSVSGPRSTQEPPPALPTPSSLYSRHAGLLLSRRLPGTATCFSITALAVPSSCNALPSHTSSLHTKVTSSVKPALITQRKIVTSWHSQLCLHLAPCLPLPSPSLSVYNKDLLIFSV